MPTLHLSGSRIEYLELGSGEPVVLLHASASSGTQWRALAERLSDRYHVFAPDLYGYGGTAHWPGRQPFHLECEAEIVLALLARANQPTHLVGHSYGGALALHVARSRSDLLCSLTLIEPVAFHLLRGRDGHALAEITQVAASVVCAIANGDYAAGCARFVDYWNGPQAWAGMSAGKREAMAARLPKVALDFHAALNEPARAEDYELMALPSLIVQGAMSPAPTSRIGELLAVVLPDAELSAVEGAGHMAPVTHAEVVNAMIAAHIDANSGRASRVLEAVHIPAGNKAASTADIVA